jgi:hypothetical protein
VEDGTSLPGQLTEERERHNALPAARTAADDDRGLPIRTVRSLDGVQDHLVRQLLVTHESEALPPLHLVGGQGQQLPARGDRGIEQQVPRGRALFRRVQTRSQVVDERTSPLAGEQPAVRILRSDRQVIDAGVRRIVEVGDAGDRIPEILECAVVIGGRTGQSMGSYPQVGRIGRHPAEGAARLRSREENCWLQWWLQFGGVSGVSRRTEPQVKASADVHGPQFPTLLVRFGVHPPSRVRIPEPPPAISISPALTAPARPVGRPGPQMAPRTGGCPVAGAPR